MRLIGKDLSNLGLTVTVPRDSGQFVITAEVTSQEIVGGSVVDSQTVQASTELVDVTHPGLIAEFYNYDGHPNIGSIADAEAVISNATFTAISVDYGLSSSDLGTADHLLSWIRADSNTLHYNNKVSTSDAVMKQYYYHPHKA